MEGIIIAVLSLLGTLGGSYFANKRSSAPVSYTHLDVYKRQPLHVLPVASKLIDYTLDLTDNTKHFPKKVRFTIVNRIQDHVLRCV